ncbi:MAG TPA: hypothetical protein VIQ31_14110, partial [Phormidium sp.]
TIFCSGVKIVNVPSGDCDSLFRAKEAVVNWARGIERSPVEGGMHSAVSLYTTSSVQAGREGIRSG